MTEEILKHISKQLADLQARVSAIEGLVSSSMGAAGEKKQAKSQSFREFMEEKGPKDDVQRTLATGYFLEHIRGMSAFNTEDIKKELSQAKIMPPQNINDKVNMNIRKGGLMMESEEKKEGKKSWKLTLSGEKVVEKGFNNK